MISDTLNEYLLRHSKKNSPFLSKLSDKTQKNLGEPHMLCGPLVGAFLNFLVKLSNAKFVLDIGTFSGYSALSIAEALDKEGKVLTCEKCANHVAVARKNFAQHKDGYKIELFYGNALDCIKSVQKPIDLSFLDADKRPSIEYYDLIVEKTKPGGAIVIDDALWKGEIVKMSEPKHLIMDELNKYILNDPRVENVLIPLRHGINLVYKIKS